jgi:hypothetical protein
MAKVKCEGAAPALDGEDRRAVARLLELNDRSAGVGLVVTKSGQKTKVSTNHPDESVGLVLLAEALGSCDPDFLNGMLAQLANAALTRGEVDEDKLNFALSSIKDIGPKGSIETMLAAQMVLVHLAAMTASRRLAQAETIPQQDSAERLFNKLMRTFAGQVETLKRYRTGGEQKVTVTHVSVEKGGQAIVGNVTQAATDNATFSTDTTPSALPAADGQPMPII